MMSRVRAAKSGLKWIEKSLSGKTKGDALKRHRAWLEGELRALGLFAREVGVSGGGAGSEGTSLGPATVTLGRGGVGGREATDSEAMEGPVMFTVGSGKVWETLGAGSGAGLPGVEPGSEREWVWRKGEKLPIRRVGDMAQADVGANAAEAPAEPAVPVEAKAQEQNQAKPEASSGDGNGAPEMIDGWPRECELSIEGYPLNPKLMIGRLYGEAGGQTFRRVSVWRVRGRNLRPGMRVACRLDRAGANPVYLPV